jgi:hypothetical protein
MHANIKADEKAELRGNEVFYIKTNKERLQAGPSSLVDITKKYIGSILNMSIQNLTSLKKLSWFVSEGH